MFMVRDLLIAAAAHCRPQPQPHAPAAPPLLGSHRRLCLLLWRGWALSCRFFRCRSPHLLGCPPAGRPACSRCRARALRPPCVLSLLCPRASLAVQTTFGVAPIVQAQRCGDRCRGAGHSAEVPRVEAPRRWAVRMAIVEPPRGSVRQLQPPLAGGRLPLWAVWPEDRRAERLKQSLVRCVNIPLEGGAAHVQVRLLGGNAPQGQGGGAAAGHHSCGYTPKARLHRGRGRPINGTQEQSCSATAGAGTRQET